MNNSRLTELTNKYIDKELTGDEITELEKLLKDNNNKKYFDSMINTINVLEKNKPAEKVINVKEYVVNKIKNNEEETLMKKIKTWFSGTFAGPKISYAISFAFGALLVGLIFTLQPVEQNIDDVFMTGVMSNRSFDETYFLEEHSLSGAIKVKQSEGIVILDVDLKTSEILDCDLSFDKTQFALYGVKSIESKNSGQFASSGNSVRLSNLQSNHYLVFLRNLKNNESKVRASFYRGGMTVANLTIDIKK